MFLSTLVCCKRVASGVPFLSSTSDLVAFHKNLTEIESITYNEQEVGEWLSSSLEQQGYNVEKQYLDDDSGRFNVYAYPGKTRETDTLVSSHIDTVSIRHCLNAEVQMC